MVEPGLPKIPIRVVLFRGPETVEVDPAVTSTLD
jgi:hypothetical protein